jgi:hypothetical protein
MKVIFMKYGKTPKRLLKVTGELSCACFQNCLAPVVSPFPILLDARNHKNCSVDCKQAFLGGQEEVPIFPSC